MSVNTEEREIDNTLGRYVENTFPPREEVKKLFMSGRQLSIYWGIDPTGPDMHLGHVTNLLLLKKLKSLGHKIIILVGDFTAQIGDPTDKSAVRSALTKTQVKENMKTYLDQIHKILPKGSYEVEHNSKWLSKLTLEDVRGLMSNFTVQQMLARDMFQKRISDEKPVYLHEFLYPIMQGYDSVAMSVDAEVGGNDQAILALSRERNSGTHIFVLEEVVRKGNRKGPEEFAPHILMMPSSQAIEQEVSDNVGAIGYFGMGYLGPRV